MKNKMELEGIAKQLRRSIYQMALNSGTKGAHIGGSLSCVEILTSLYGSVMHYNVKDGAWVERDRFVMSKAHSTMAHYAALNYAGFISDEELDGAMRGDSHFYKHPRFNLDKGIEFSGGSLGQGLGLAVGSMLALKLRGIKGPRFYVLLGDGECDEGSVWEAAASVIQYQLNDLVIILDRNHLQNDGNTTDIMAKGDLAKRFGALGFEIVEVDGHNVMQLQEVLNRPAEQPRLVLANTIKGKGCSFAENNYEWHIGYFTEELYNTALEELNNDADQ